MSSNEEEVFGCVVVDLDGTLCNVEHRVHHAANKDWDLFHSGLSDDTVNESVAMIINNLPHSIKLIACTGRNERYRNQTIEWLLKNDIIFDEILMRPNDNFSPDYVLKIKMIVDFFDGNIDIAKEQIICCLDDRDKVVEAFREAGFNCWQVKNESY